MQKLMAITIIGFALTVSVATSGQEAEPRDTKQTTFLKTNTWWNFYFDTKQDPLKRGTISIHPVKVLETDSRRPEWVKVAFPKNQEDHLSMLRELAKASENETVQNEEALAEYERGISKWNIIWVNLNFVARISRVE